MNLYSEILVVLNQVTQPATDVDPIDQRRLWREAYLSDPDGNTICLYHAGKNRLHPPWRIA